MERLERPADLEAVLSDQLPLWEDWPRPVRRGTLEWIKTAKAAPTRAKRIADVTARAGLPLVQFRG